MHRLAGVLISTMGLSCGAPPATTTAPVPIQIAVAKQRPKAKPKQRWYYYPTGIPKWLDGRVSADGRWLLLDDSGDRWLSQPPSQSPAGKSSGGKPRSAVVASIHRAPEALTRVVRNGSGWRFSDDAGNLYGSDSPLGALTLVTRAPAKLRAFTLWEKGAIGFDDAGRGHRFNGEAWSQLPAMARWPFALERTKENQLIAIAAPEQILSSNDGGQSWQTISTPTFGARALRRAKDGAVVVVGIAQNKQFKDGAITAIKKTRGTPPRAFDGNDFVPVRGPSTVATTDHAATLTGDRYYEIIAGVDDETAPWQLLSGPLGGPYQRVDLAIKESCDMRLRAAGDHVMLACYHEQDGKSRLLLFRSMDGGRQFNRHASLRTRSNDISFAVNRRGEALVLSACPQKPDANTSPKCAKSTVSWVSASGEVQPQGIADISTDLAMPTLATFSEDGRHAYFVAGSKKVKQPALFIANKYGGDFYARALKPKDADSASEESSDIPAGLHPGADGSLGISFHGGQPAYVSADASGRAIRQAQFPKGARAAGGSGRLILASGKDEQASGNLALWVSRNAGVSFSQLSMPTPVKLYDIGEGTKPVCSSAGCFIGNSLTRLGWESDDDTATPLRRREEANEALVPEMRDAIVCDLDDNNKWHTFDHITRPALPDVNVAMRGKSLWSVLQVHADGRVVSHSMSVTAPSKSALRSHQLLSTTRAAQNIQQISPQMEGYAAARTLLPKGGFTSSTRANIEVAWINYITDVRGRGSARDMPLSPMDVSKVRRTSNAAALKMKLLSVSPKSIFVRSSAHHADTVVIGPRGSELVRANHPPSAILAARQLSGDATWINKTALAISTYALSGNHRAYIATTPFNGSPSFMTLLPPVQMLRLKPTWTYQGNRVGALVQNYDSSGQHSRAYFLPFTAAGIGPASSVPTTVDLVQATPCSVASRRSSPRVLAPYLPGKRRPVLIRGAEHLNLMTSFSVLHGTPQSPCVAAWSATPIKNPSSKGASALVIAGNKQLSWLFRREGRDQLSYRAMRCRVDPSAKVPEQYLQAPGVLRRR